MYLSRIDLHYRDLPIAMLRKLDDGAAYALHQWLWQLFPESSGRNFLFRQEPLNGGLRCHMLSTTAPAAEHNLLRLTSKPFTPQLAAGDGLRFALRANPVITRQGKRSDVLMDAKHQAAKEKGEEHDDKWLIQQAAAINWLTRQGKASGFSVSEKHILVSGYQQHHLNKPKVNDAIHFSSVDFSGVLTLTDPALFIPALAHGFGKCKGFGCGLMLIKRV